MLKSNKQPEPAGPALALSAVADFLPYGRFFILLYKNILFLSAVLPRCPHLFFKAVTSKAAEILFPFFY